MRLNKYLASATNLSRRSADKAIEQGRVQINGKLAKTGLEVSDQDTILLDGKPVQPPKSYTTILLNKPVGYVCSRDGQGAKTVFDLLPPEYQMLQTVGRLDKDSSGLLLLTNDGELANRLTHPSYNKQKIYQLELNRSLSESDAQQIEQGVALEDGLSKLRIKDVKDNQLTVVMSEGRNRQIRRTFAALGYTVTNLHRTNFGDYSLPELLPFGRYKAID